MNYSLEDALRKFAEKLTGKNVADIPQELERIIAYTADNLEMAAGVQGPKGDPGTDGKGVATIKIIVSDSGTIESGKWIDTSGIEHDITIE